jgi:cobalt-zinc-cadmium resistance protein CzcA
MLGRLIESSLRNRFVILLLALVLVALGLKSAIDLPLDAFPDTTPNQVQINTNAPALGPEEIERQVTYPVELALGGLKGLEEVRSISKFGLSQVVAIFSDDVSIYFARQQIMERLSELQLPAGIERPTLGPVATGLGEVFHYYMTSRLRDAMELRTLHDWVVRPRLRRVPGVAEVNTLGGYEKRYEVRIDPARLAAYELTMEQVVATLEANNANVGGGPIQQAGEQILVQGIGLVRSVDEIANIVLKAVNGVPIRVKDVGAVAIGHTICRGGTTANGEGRVVLGLAFMRMGENSRNVTIALEKALRDVREQLPDDVEVRVVYRRTDLVNHVLRTVEQNLFEGAILVVAILFAFLGNFRAGLIVALAIPLSMLFAVTMMQRVGIAGSLLSLGAIDFGLVVDSSVVMVENCMRRLSHEGTRRPRLELVREAALEVRKPTMFGELIIMIVYLPILTLEGTEGKLFRPMALVVVFALAASMVLSLTLMPVLASIGLPRKLSEEDTPVARIFRWLFRPLFWVSMRFPRLVLGVIAACTVIGLALGTRLGSEFIPRLYEGTIVFNTIRQASVSLDESERYGTEIEKLLRLEFPDELENVWTRTGTAEVATDPMGLETSDVFVTLKPRESWKRAKSQAEIVEQMSAVVGALPGMEVVFSQPIEQRINEMIAGIRADLGVKIFGDDLDELVRLANHVKQILEGVPGAADVSVEPVTGLPVLRVEIDRQALSRHGVPAQAVLDAVRAISGIEVGEIREPVTERRFPLVVRLTEEYRLTPEALERIWIPTADGQRLPLTRVARLVATTGPSTIQREWGRRRIIVQANVRGRDVGGFVQESQKRIQDELQLPLGYTLEWGGQFENMIRAGNRLKLVVPLALGLVMSLLYLTFRSIRDALIIASGMLLAWVGGVFGLLVTQQPITISAGVGFIALAGAAMLQGLVLVSAIRDRLHAGIDKRHAIEMARDARLRPVLMTGFVAAMGFAPMMVSTGIGAEVQRPLATVVVFGMFFDTILTMVALPALYLLWGKAPAPPHHEPRDRFALDDDDEPHSDRELEAHVVGTTAEARKA